MIVHVIAGRLNGMLVSRRGKSIDFAEPKDPEA
jgi:hypothetical protein